MEGQRGASWEIYTTFTQLKGTILCLEQVNCTVDHIIPQVCHCNTHVNQNVDKPEHPDVTVTSVQLHSTEMKKMKLITSQLIQ